MRKSSMNQALSAALDAESDAFKARLARAETALGEATAPATSPDAAPPEAAKAIERVVREAFTIPEAEHAQIAAIRQKMLGQSVHVTKSEVMRAGLLLLSGMNDAELEEVFARVEKIKTGRPKTV